MSETESFEDARISAQAMIYDCDIPLLDRLKAAHDREMRDTAQQQYDRGYHDGTHSMDAEHRAVSMRLRLLPRGCTGFSDAHVSWFADLAWAMGIKEPTFASLRDELVRLMGGVSDDTCDSQCCGACAAGDGGDSGEQAEVSDDGADRDTLGPDARGHVVGRDFHELGVSDGRTADDSDGNTGGSYRGLSVHLDGLTGYDVLGNERQKAVCELRKLSKCGMGPHGFRDGLAAAINVPKDGAPYDDGELCKLICDRLIHLLGGDQPSGIDVLREMDEREAKGRITDELREFVDDNWPIEIDDARILREKEGSVPYSLLLISDRIDARHYLTRAVAEASTSDEWTAMSEYDKLREERDELRTELEELRGHSRTCTESSDEASESAPSVYITDELRECVYTATKTYDDTPWHEMGGDSNADHTICYVTEGELLRIADRIDEQFERICQQQEAVLQETIDGMVKEYEHDRLPDQLRIEKLEKQRDHWHQQATDMMNHADAMEHERDDACAERDEMKKQFAKLCVERADLLALLRDAREEYKTLDQMSTETSAHFHVMRGRVWGLEAERDELQSKLDEYDSTHVELPRDANGEVFRLGCTVRMVERHPEVLLTVHSMTLCDDGEWLLYAWDDEEKYSCNLSTSEFEVCDEPRDTAESIVRDLSMGAVTESEAINRIEALNG